jgi:DNA polymerase-3 subunit delta
MPALTERAFHKALKSASFERVYYLHGEDDYLKDGAVRQLIAAAVDPATRDFNLDVRAAAELDPETLGSLIGTPPMMAERRVVVVRDVAALRKDARAVLDRYLAAPAPDVLLVLVAAGGEKAKADKDLVQRAASLEFELLAGDRVPKWIAHHATTELRVAIAPDAADLLHRAVGGDLPSLAAELDKLASYTNGAPIDEAAVSDVVGVRRGETLGDFLDRVAQRDVTGALALLGHVLEQPKTTAVSIVMALTTQTLALAWGEATPGRADYFAFLKAGGAITGRPWGDAAAAWARAQRHWDADALDAALDALLDADIALKESRVSSDEQILSTLVLAMCARPSRGAPRRRLAAAAL